MSTRKGNISVQTSDIFPIIKKWLYSEHDIFLRELVANATDAITKRATLSRGQNLEIPEGKIQLNVDKEAGTITIIDNGVGMTEAEIEKYIAQLAFSGAEEFVRKMKDEGQSSTQDIIGKFGLGFYSAFMVAKNVEIDSLSYVPGSKASHWSCDGTTEFEFSESSYNEVGTKITLHIDKENEHAAEFLNSWKVTETLRNFCDFLPYPIKVGEDLVNDTKPLWRQDPLSLKDEDYKTFFKKLFPMDQDPLFWVHLKVDHPFTLEGILYFPKINPMRPVSDRGIRLYNKQVFVSDNVKGVVPEFLGLLKGVIDSSDIPLNVSRSSLQGDPNIKKISNYIIKKVAEALKKLMNSDRARFETIWEDIALFVKYGCISDTKFDELMKEYVLFKNSENKLVTIAEWQASVPEQFKEKLKEKVLYFEKGKSDTQLRKHLLDLGVHALETDEHIDPHFTQHLEVQGLAKNEKGETVKLQFVSIDGHYAELMAQENTTDTDIKVKEMFAKILGAGRKDEEFAVEIAKLKDSPLSAYFKIDESSKRFAKMAQHMGGNFSMPIKKTLMLNPASQLVQNALKLHTIGEEKLADKICHHIEDLAAISSEGLKNEDKENFVRRSQDLIAELTAHYGQ